MASPRSASRPARPTARAIATTAVLVLLLAACASGTAPEPEVGASPAEPADGDAVEDTELTDEDEASDDTTDGDGRAEEAGGDASANPPVDPAEVGADELGVIPVMMYHQIREDGGSEWDMSPEEFRAELTAMFDAGFVPIRARDLVAGEIDVPAGRSPVVLTFDDSTRGQAHLDDDGTFATDTAMGILTEVAAAYDDVEPIASLYLITSSLFGGVADGPDIVRALHEHGMELGNHTHTHANLRSLSPDEAREELARAVVEITDIVPDAEVVTLSLPFGIFPEERELAAAGVGESGRYEHAGVLLVGDRPAPSPFHADFDPLAIPRIKTLPDPEAEFGSAWWLDVMASSPSWRPYVSDGDPTTISFPADRADELDPALEDRANPY